MSEIKQQFQEIDQKVQLLNDLIEKQTAEYPYVLQVLYRFQLISVMMEFAAAVPEIAIESEKIKNVINQIKSNLIRLELESWK